MNRERTAKLLKSTGLAVLKWPDGGVVTQRTANPLTVARFRDSSHNSPSVPPIAFQGLRERSANRKSRSKPDRAETVKQGSVHESGGRAAICPKPVKGDHPMTMKELAERCEALEAENRNLRQQLMPYLKQEEAIKSAREQMRAELAEGRAEIVKHRGSLTDTQVLRRIARQAARASQEATR